MQVRYCKALYSKQALLKAAFHFTDEYYVMLDCDNDYYVVEIIEKNEKQNTATISEEFGNELLAQMTRETILEETADIRKLILGRAFASTIIDSLEENGDDEESEEDPGLFEDWYESENRNG